MIYSSNITDEFMDSLDDALVDHMVDAGMDYYKAELETARILPLQHDPRGFAAALIDDEPELAKFLGYTRLH